MHPWEDWAESWAHYMHMVDALETAGAAGLALRPKRSDEPRMQPPLDPLNPGYRDFDSMMSLESRRVVGALVAEGRAAGLQQGTVRDQPIPEVMADLVTEVPQ